MIECPHLVHATLPNGGRSPGMKTFVSHHPHVTMRNGLSLMLESIYHHSAIRQVLRKGRFAGLKNLFDKRGKMVFLPAS
jgi:hypothetical protein